MDDIRSKQRKPDDPRYIGIVFADGSGKFVNIGKLAFIDQCLPTECPCNIGYHRVGKTRLRIRRDNSQTLLLNNDREAFNKERQQVMEKLETNRKNLDSLIAQEMEDLDKQISKERSDFSQQIQKERDEFSKQIVAEKDAFAQQMQRERAALQAERDAFIQQKEAAFLKLDELRAEIAQKSEEENNKIEADKQKLHLQQLEFVKQQAKAKNNFVTQQKEAFKEAFETRDAELQAWQDRIEKKEAELAEKIKEFYQKEGKLAEREINVTEREEKVDAGLADRVHALAEENKRQHEANQAEAERLKEWAKQLSKQEAEQKKDKDNLRVREAAILNAEQERNANYSDERHALDIELNEKRQQHIQMLEKERASSVGDVENELAKLRETRLASIKQDEEIEVARIRGIVVAEKEAWEAEKKAQEVKLQNDKNEIACASATKPLQKFSLIPNAEPDSKAS